MGQQTVTSGDDLASLTAWAKAAVKANDRRARRRAFFRAFRRPLELTMLAWSALVFAGFVLVLLPVNMRVA